MVKFESLPPKSHENQPPKVYSVPRRFGIGSLLAVATAYALIIWGMQQLDWPPDVIIINAIFLTLIGAMQMALTETPRWASIAVGAACVFAMFLFGVARFRNVPDIAEMLVWAVVSVVGGGLYGYLGGALVAGVFLIIDASAKFITRRRYDELPGD